jgi:hypothetical protein
MKKSFSVFPFFRRRDKFFSLKLLQDPYRTMCSVLHHTACEALPRARWIGLGFFFQEMKIRYTGTLEKIMRQP